jgi:catechol 2,3-dioxygenase-like lactoylglutathione lyase family enzyme
MTISTQTILDSIHHLAIPVRDVAEAVQWYTSHFQCTISYQDPTWALLEFANLKLALVIPSQHPGHIAFVIPDAEKYGTLKPHRDGTRSCYISDPSGNAVELLAQD